MVGGQEWASFGGEGDGAEYFRTFVRLWFEVANMLASTAASTAASHPASHPASSSASSSANNCLMRTCLRYGDLILLIDSSTVAGIEYD